MRQEHVQARIVRRQGDANALGVVFGHDGESAVEPAQMIGEKALRKRQTGRGFAATQAQTARRHRVESVDPEGRLCSRRPFELAHGLRQRELRAGQSVEKQPANDFAAELHHTQCREHGRPAQRAAFPVRVFAGEDAVAVEKRAAALLALLQSLHGVRRGIGRRGAVPSPRPPQRGAARLGARTMANAKRPARRGAVAQPVAPGEAGR